MTSRPRGGGVLGQRTDGPRDAPGRLRPLDTGVGEDDLEPEAAAHELVVEVVPRRRAGAADNTDPQRDPAQLLPAVGVERPVGGQPAQHLVALLGEITEREAGIEVGHLQTELAAGGVEVQVAEDAHLHADREAQAVASQERAQPQAGVGEQLHAHDGLAARRIVGQREVGVSAALVPLADLAAHPYAIGERAAQRLVHGIGQLADA